MRTTRFVRVWSGKWHLLEKEMGITPAQPSRYEGGPQWNAVSKPARVRVLTGCGLRAFARDITTDPPAKPKWGRPPWCSACSAVWEARDE